MKKTISCLVLAIVLLLCTFSGCAGSKGSTEQETREKKISQTITVNGETIRCPLYKYDVLSDNTVRIDRIFNVGRDLTIPDAIDGFTVSTLGRNMLRAEYLDNTIVSIPACVTALEGNPFDCQGSNIKIKVSPANSELAVIDDVLFSTSDHRLICAFNSVTGTYDEPGNYTVPDGTASIEDHAFRYANYTYGTISIPDSVTALGRNPFAFCNSHKEAFAFSIAVSETHPTLEIIDGMLYSKPDHRLVCYADQNANYVAGNPDGIGSRSVPDGTEIIDDLAFYSAGGVNKSCGPHTISIPASVTQLGINPFYDNPPELKDLIIDPSNHALDLVDGLLYSKADHRLVSCIDFSRKEYIIEEDTEIIGAYSFSGTPHLLPAIIEMSDRVTEIGDQAFAEMCFTSTLICDFPSSLQKIGVQAFSGNTAPIMNRQMYMVDLMFDGGVEIGAYAFSGWGFGFGTIGSLSVSGQGEVYIGRNAFSWCSGLKTVRIEGEAWIADGAFQNSGIEEAYFGEGLNSIGAYAFLDSLLWKIVLPESVTSIGDFYTNTFLEYDSVHDVEQTVYKCFAEVYVKPGSYAEEFCNSNDITCYNSEREKD